MKGCVIVLHESLEVIEFENIDALHEWLLPNHNKSKGIWIKIYKTKSCIKSVTFIEVLEEGLCFGWSESLRHPLDELSYLQKFTPRKAKKTISERNLTLAKKLAEENRMTSSGYEALSISKVV